MKNINRLHDGDFILYKILGEIFYAEIRDIDPLFSGEKYVTIQTHFNFYQKYNINLGKSDWSELDIEYIISVVPPDMTQEELILEYPEYLI